jgi:peroxiredoxin
MAGLLAVDWTRIPAPQDDGGGTHLLRARVPDVALPSTTGVPVSLAQLKGRVVVFAYPRTGTPAQTGLVDDWDLIPGARGCTPQTCAFRDANADLRAAGATQVFGLSVQDTAYQQEMASRLHVPFPILSDAGLRLALAMRLPTMTVADVVLIKRLALVIDDGQITAVFYPVFPPDRNAADVLAWLRANPIPTPNPQRG